MVTDLAQHDHDSSAPAEGLLGRATTHMRQFVCGLHGHDALLHFEEDRISLLCSSCGHETPGWEVGRTRAHEAQRQQARQPMIRMPLVSQRRVA